VAGWVGLCCGKRERGGKTGLRKGRVPWPKQENDNSTLGQEERNDDGRSEVGSPGSLRGSIMRSHRGGESVMEEYGAPPPYQSVVDD